MLLKKERTSSTGKLTFPEIFLASCLVPACRRNHSQAGPEAFFSGSWGPAGPGRSTVKPAYSPALLAVFLKGFLCHGLHKFRIVPGEVFWEDHGDGVGIKELHNHLSDARGSTGVRSLGTHLGGKRVREGPKYWSK